jgi:hypothetical protein
MSQFHATGGKTLTRTRAALGLANPGLFVSPTLFYICIVRPQSGHLFSPVDVYLYLLGSDIAAN